MNLLLVCLPLPQRLKSKNYHIGFLTSRVPDVIQIALTMFSSMRLEFRAELSVVYSIGIGYSTRGITFAGADPVA